jgi:hypothetical protein
VIRRLCRRRRSTRPWTTSERTRKPPSPHRLPSVRRSTPVRYVVAVARHAVPWVTSGIRVATLVAGLLGVSTGAGLLAQDVGIGLIVLGVLLIAGSMLGSYGAWKSADARARSYEGDTELQRGLAESLRDGRQVRGRLIGASEKGVRHVALEVWGWASDQHPWLDERMGVDELAEEWLEAMAGANASGLDEFAGAWRPLAREPSRLRGPRHRGDHRVARATARQRWDGELRMVGSDWSAYVPYTWRQFIVGSGWALSTSSEWRRMKPHVRHRSATAGYPSPGGSRSSRKCWINAPTPPVSHAVPWQQGQLWLDMRKARSAIASASNPSTLP